jgi:predicted nuclease of predicted toxin-antitoxin system
VRLLLDAQLSHRRIAEPLRVRGHDVHSLQTDPALDGLDDEDVLALATSERRIVVTRNSRHFGPLTRLWAEAGRDHAGCILIWSYRHDEYASIIRGVERLLADTPRQKDWRNLVLAV